MRSHLEMRGLYRVIKEDRTTGERAVGDWRPNAITTAGKNIFLDIIRGSAGSGDVYDQANSQIRIYDGSPGTLVKTLTGADAAFPSIALNGANLEVTWEWSDISVDVYNAARIELRNRAGGSGNTIFSDAAPAFGTKPNTQNWIYQYKLILTGIASAPFGDGTGHYSGVRELLEMFIGEQVDRYDTDTELFVEGSSSGTYSQVADGAPTRTGQTVTWTFTVAEANGNAPNNWQDITIRKTLTDCTNCVLRKDNEGWPAKQSNEQRIVTYELTV
jgi:hypothetical protein